MRTAARAMLASVFVASGVNAVQNPAKLALRAKKVTDQVGPKLQQIHPKIPTDAETMVRVNGAVHIVGGLAMLTPAQRLGAAALVVSLVPTTLAGPRVLGVRGSGRPGPAAHPLLVRTSACWAA